MHIMHISILICIICLTNLELIPGRSFSSNKQRTKFSVSSLNKINWGHIIHQLTFVTPSVKVFRSMLSQAMKGKKYQKLGKVIKFKSKVVSFNRYISSNIPILYEIILRREKYVIDSGKIPFIANIFACLIKPVTDCFINIVRYQMTYMQQILQYLYHTISPSYVL